MNLIHYNNLILYNPHYKLTMYYATNVLYNML